MVYDPIKETAIYQPTGNKTEVAMLNFLYANNVEAHTELSIRQQECEVKYSLPFDPFRKTQLTATRLPSEKKEDGKVRVVLKGAPEIVIEHCSKILMRNMQEPVDLKY